MIGAILPFCETPLREEAGTGTVLDVVATPTGAGIDGNGLGAVDAAAVPSSAVESCRRPRGR